MKINTENITQCVSCRACEQKCPKNAIAMIENSEGFLFPRIDELKCIDCGLCYNSCPINYVFEKPKYNDTYAMILKDKEKLLNSTSGGVFCGFAEKILGLDGVVFGANISDKFDVAHKSIVSTKDLKLLQGSKYVNSDTNSSYKETEALLKKGVKVLYSGTPCQIAGLKSFLGKDYGNLYTVDLICHGTPSNKLFKLYISWLEKKYNGTVIDYKFRNKEISTGCGQNIIFYVKKRNKIKKVVLSGLLDPFMYSFMNRHIQRESCYNCKFMDINRISDCTIGDFWEIKKYHPEIDISKGVSVCIVNTEKGLDLFEKSKDLFEILKSDINYACKGNSHLYKIAAKPSERSKTYRSVEKNVFNEKDFYHVSKIKYFLIKTASAVLPDCLKKLIKKILGK